MGVTLYDVTFTTTTTDNRMFEFLKTKTFDAVFSFILGLGCIALLKPVCKGINCQVQKAPPLDEVRSSTYQMGSKCYKFEIKHTDCPEKGVIEPFERFIR